MPRDSKRSWNEMKKPYPDQWLEIVEFETGKFGEMLRGQGLPWSLDALLDTGAPWTELSDSFLHHAGFLIQTLETDTATMLPNAPTQLE